MVGRHLHGLHKSLQLCHPKIGTTHALVTSADGDAVSIMGKATVKDWCVACSQNKLLSTKAVNGPWTSMDDQRVSAASCVHKQRGRFQPSSLRITEEQKQGVRHRKTEQEEQHEQMTWH